MKTLISAETVRAAQAQGITCLPAGAGVMVTAEARDLADKLGVRLDPAAQSMHATNATHAGSPAHGPAAAGGPDLAAIRAAVEARLPPDAVGNRELVEQIVRRVSAERAHAAQSPAPAAPVPSASNASKSGCRIKLVKSSDVHLGVFPGAGADKQVGIADVITAADGAPIAAGFMAWSQSFFPWTLDYDEIDLVLEGELHIRCDGQTFVGKSGDVFYIPKGSSIEFGTTSAVRFFYVTYPANWQG